jgi:hypothetical protein
MPIRLYNIADPKGTAEHIEYVKQSAYWEGVRAGITLGIAIGSIIMINLLKK